jgi:hypothetical protein
MASERSIQGASPENARLALVSRDPPRDGHQAGTKEARNRERLVDLLAVVDLLRPRAAGMEAAALAEAADIPLERLRPPLRRLRRAGLVGWTPSLTDGDRGPGRPRGRFYWRPGSGHSGT